MDQVLPGIKGGKSRVLVAPLDWGLGHATRCIPIIRRLIDDGNEVFLAGEGAQETILRSEFPKLEFIPLKGYRVQYAKSATGLAIQLIRQAPGIQKTIKQENVWLKNIIQQYQLDTIISDNRYGLYNENVNCIFVTHQLMIKTGLGKWSEKILQKKNYDYINRFNSCWVPDFSDENNLSGELGHPGKMPAIPVHYIGPLSRFEKLISEKSNSKLLIILSGPEPQRSLLEEIILRQISKYDGSLTLVRGLPDSSSIIPSTTKINIYNHLPSNELNRELCEASLVVCRSGYSSVMDLYKLGKNAVLIPTPGQTEQQYLAEYLSKKNMFQYTLQKSFSLERVLSLVNFI